MYKSGVSFFPIADSLSMSMKLKNGRLYGAMDKTFEIAQMIKLRVQPYIIDSQIDDHCGMAAVVVHVIGHLYLLVINDERKQSITIMILNGKKLGWDVTKLPIVFKNDVWTRKGLYTLIVDGVENIYWRKVKDNDWTNTPHSKSMIKEYVKLRNEGYGSTPAHNKAVMSVLH